MDEIRQLIVRMATENREYVKSGIMWCSGIS
jgi:hypothetical protein